MKRGIWMLPIVTAAAIVAASQAFAMNVTIPVTGTLGPRDMDGPYSFVATLNLDVENGQVVSGMGTLTSSIGLTAVPLILILSTTPGNISSTFGPVGFAANDGTQYFGLNTNYPLDRAGLLFDVGTRVAEYGNFPLLNIDGAGGSEFTGVVNGVTHFDLIGTSFLGPAVVTAGPDGAPAPLAGAGLLSFLGAGGVAMRKRAKRVIGSLLSRGLAAA